MDDQDSKPIGVNIGDLIADKYLVEARIGTGGMGAVVAARHTALGARVAIKILLPETAGDPEAIARFSREARAMFNLKSEHAAKVLDVGKLPNGGPFMVMEYLSGSDLASALHQRGHFTPMEAAHLVLQACEAVAEAHSLGIVHRDLKPQNLFLSTRVDGSASIKVLDFGISKMPIGKDEEMSVTHSSAVMGTPLYMSPEQLHSSASADARSDIWAIGVVLYELLTGKVPFEAPSAPALYGLMLSSKPKPPRDLRPEIPEELSLVVMRCLERDRDARFKSVAELATQLEPFAPDSMNGAGLRLQAVHDRNADRRTRTPTALAETQAASGASGAVPTQATWADATTKRLKKTSPVMIAGAVAVVLASAFAVRTLLRDRPSVHADASPTSSAVDLASADAQTPITSDSAPFTASSPASAAASSAATMIIPEISNAVASSSARPAHPPTHKTRPASQHPNAASSPSANPLLDNRNSY
ncbi:MAG: serine/threonine-protein kinase [Polyangiaceae bacterium]